MEKTEHSPQPAFVEKDAPPLCVLSPPGAIIYEGRHYKLVSFRHFVRLIKEKTFILESRENQQTQFKKTKRTHSPDSEFLLPMRPTKMSCSSPDNRNDSDSALDFHFVRMQEKKSKVNPFGLKTLTFLL